MNIIHKNPTEESFLMWMEHYPESGHTCDMQRFYVFARSVHRYRATSWLKFSIFSRKVKKYAPDFSDEKIVTFHEKLCEYNELLKSYHFPSITTDGVNWVERRIKDGKRVDKHIPDIKKYFNI